MADRLTELLETRPWLLADGATGTNFFAMGLQHGDAPELWNLAQPDDVVRHYRSFIDAGSDIVLTNSFGGTANRLKLHKADDRVFELNQAAAALRSEEHTSELQSLMRISYAVFCLKKKTTDTNVKFST